MRLRFLTVGIVIVFVGLLLISLSRTPNITEEENRDVTIKYGERDSLELTDVPLNKSDKFYVVISGGSTYTNPDDIDVVVTDPLNNSTTLTYTNAGPVGPGLIANYTGNYKVQILGMFIDPSRPALLKVGKIINKEVVTYPNSSMLYPGLSVVIIGAGVSLGGALGSKPMASRVKTRKRK